MAQNENTAAAAAAAAAAAQNQPAVVEPRDPRFFWLTVAQFALIIGVAIALVYAITNGVKDVKELADLDTARGLITFVITLGTVTIAIMLTLTAVLVRDFDKRITVGKEVLTVLVGVLGTIVGFYYGAAATKKDAGASTQTAQVSVAPVKIPEEVKSGDKVTIGAKLTGGTAPYSYSIKFTPDTIQEIKGDSAKGDISHEITAAVPAGNDIVFVIEGTDKSGTPFAYNKDLKQKIHVR